MNVSVIPTTIGHVIRSMTGDQKRSCENCASHGIPIACNRSARVSSKSVSLVSDGCDSWNTSDVTPTDRIGEEFPVVDDARATLHPVFTDRIP